MKKAILSLAALTLGLGLAGPVRADEEDLEDRVARLEKLLKRLEQKIDEIGEHEGEEPRVEKFEKRVHLFHPDDAAEAVPGRRVVFYRFDHEEADEGVVLPRAGTLFTRKLPEPGAEPFKIVRVKAADDEAYVEIEIDGVVYEGELRRREKGDKAGKAEPRREKGERKEREKGDREEGRKKERGESKADEPREDVLRWRVEGVEPAKERMLEFFHAEELSPEKLEALRLHPEKVEALRLRAEALDLEPKIEKATRAFRTFELELPEGMDEEEAIVRKKLRALRDGKEEELRELHRKLDRLLEEKDED